MENPERTRALLLGALSGDAAEMRALVPVLRPAIQASVAVTLLRYRGAAKGRAVSQEVDDFVQEVFLRLFANGGHELRSWQPSLGSLSSYVAMAAKRDVLSILRSRVRSPFTEDPVESEVMDGAPRSEPTPETATLSRDLLRRVVERLREELGPRGAAVFELLVVEEHAVEHVCAVLSMSADAVYAWRSRIARRAREIGTELASDSPAPARTTNREIHG